MAGSDILNPRVATNRPFWRSFPGAPAAMLQPGGSAGYRGGPIEVQTPWIGLAPAQRSHAVTQSGGRGVAGEDEDPRHRRDSLLLRSRERSFDG